MFNRKFPTTRAKISVDDAVIAIDTWLEFLARGNLNRRSNGVAAELPQSPVLKLVLHVASASEAADLITDYRALMVQQLQQEVTPEAAAAYRAHAASGQTMMADVEYGAFIHALPEQRGMYRLDRDVRSGNLVLRVDGSNISRELSDRLTADGAKPDDAANARYRRWLTSAGGVPASATRVPAQQLQPM